MQTFLSKEFASTGTSYGDPRLEEEHKDLMQSILQGRVFTAHPSLQFDYQSFFDSKSDRFELTDDVISALSAYHTQNMVEINAAYEDVKSKTDMYFKMKLERLNRWECGELARTTTKDCHGPAAQSVTAEGFNRITSEHNQTLERLRCLLDSFI